MTASSGFPGLEKYWEGFRRLDVYVHWTCELHHVHALPSEPLSDSQNPRIFCHISHNLLLPWLIMPFPVKKPSAWISWNGMPITALPTECYTSGVEIMINDESGIMIGEKNILD